MNKKIFVLLTLASLLLLSIFAFNPERAEAITVGPVKIEYSLNPGETATGQIYLKNDETKAVTLYPTFEGFTEENGNKVFIKGDTLLKEWFNLAASVTLKAGEGVKVPYILSVPKNAPPGGQFAVIWWSASSPNAGADQVSIQTRAGILVYVNVSGDIVNTAEVTKFQSPAVSWGGTVPFNLSVSNTGTVYIKPTGTITITSLVGTSATLPINGKGYQILPKSSRDLSDMQWTPGPFSIGPYKASANVVYGQKGESVSVSKWFWVFPLKTIGLVLLVIILLVLFFKWWDRMLLQRYKSSK
jgi:hypothetical protein